MKIAALKNKIQRKWTEIMYGKQDCFKSILRNMEHRSVELHKKASLIVERSLAINRSQGRKKLTDMKADLKKSALFCLIKLDLLNFHEIVDTMRKPSSPIPAKAQCKENPIASGTKIGAPDGTDVGTTLDTTLGETVGLLRGETLGTNVTGTKLDAPDGKDVGTAPDTTKLQSPDNEDDYELESADYEILINKALEPRLDCPALYSIDATHFWEAGLGILELELSKLTISSNSLCNCFYLCNYVYTKQIKRMRKRIYLILSGHITAT